MRSPPSPFLFIPVDLAERDAELSMLYRHPTTVARPLALADVESVRDFSAEVLAEMRGDCLASIGALEVGGPFHESVASVARVLHRSLADRYGDNPQYPRICDVATLLTQEVLGETEVDFESRWTAWLHHFTEVKSPDGSAWILDLTHAQFEQTPLSRFAMTIHRLECSLSTRGLDAEAIAREQRALTLHHDAILAERGAATLGEALNPVERNANRALAERLLRTLERKAVAEPGLHAQIEALARAIRPAQG